MNFVLIALLCTFLAFTLASGQYTTKYDNIDLDQILKNDRLLNNYVDCLLEKNKCTKDGAELKKILPEAIKNGCSKCNENQKNGAKKIIHFLIETKPALWRALEVKYDPDGTYIQKYQKEIQQLDGAKTA
ncbi:hypothetical protein NQ317_013247 [Molorchus minor]|uniref:Uncharacterized protein n=1 Tax=Molorchus minor TaxID=1323400 RepID=A0ABQ9JZ35_9CUCU|nr:hypothetical protein NQ317_013247 [Molorchus minor]